MKKVVMFDFDGVIADTFDLSFSSHKKNTPETTPDRYRDIFRGNIYASHEENEDMLKNQDLINFFIHYEPGLVTHDCMPGMPEMIKRLADDYVLIIVSSTINAPINDFLARQGLGKFFTEIMGLEAERSKTKKIKMIFDKYSVGAGDCLFITDTLGDIREAERAGVKSIAVTWGFHFREMLEEGSPLAIVETVEQLEGTIRVNL